MTFPLIRIFLILCNFIERNKQNIECRKIKAEARRDTGETKTKQGLGSSMDIPIELSVPLKESYPSVVDRYFTKKYPPHSNVCLLFHSNKICLVTMAKNHEIFNRDTPVKAINFQISEKVDRSNNKVSGKGKRGGQHIGEKSVLCKVELEDGTVFPIEAGIKGKLVEINENLLTHPNLIVQRPETEGYIAVILQKLGVNNEKLNNGSS